MMTNTHGLLHGLGWALALAVLGYAGDSWAGPPAPAGSTSATSLAPSDPPSNDRSSKEDDANQWVAAATELQLRCDPVAMEARLAAKVAAIAQVDVKIKAAPKGTLKEILEADRQRLDAERIALAGHVAALAASPALCSDYCDAPTSPAAIVNFCGLADPTSTAVGLAIAPDDMSRLGDQVQAATASLALATPGYDFREVIQKLSDQPQALDLGGADMIEGSVTTLLQRGLGALARVIEDRAKREAIGWLLDEVASELCEDPLGPDEALLPLPSVARAEIRDHWMANLCALAREDRLDHYGAGAALLEALQGALENDVRGWPGVLAGIGLGELYWRSKDPPSPGVALIACVDSKDPACQNVAGLRTEGERFVGRLLEGRDPTMASRDLGTAISSIVVEDTVVSAPLELLACALSLPAEIALLEPKFRALDLDRPLTAAIMAGLIRAPACWELTGKGLNAAFTGTAELARAHHGQSRERISTILRLGKQVQTFERVQVEFEVLRQALANLESARKRKTTGGERASEIFLATLGVVDSSLASADALLVAVSRFSDATQTFPALDVPNVEERIEKANEERTKDGKATLTPAEEDTIRVQAARAAEAKIKAARAEITKLRDLLNTLQGFGTGDYAKAITASSTLMLEQLERACGSTLVNDCKARVDALGRHVGTITAILTAKNVNDMAAALDAAANPPGGWRSKAKDGNFTVSLAAYAGFFGGGEARFGQYGVNYERGGVYAQAPALALPFGLDLTWGVEVGKKRRDWAWGLFFPVLDPAAFLLYDVDKGGKLPGPRPVTALSPGAALRLGIPNTPLAVLFSATYRPQLRTWQATASGPGASVIQFGVSIAVDVTLWKIYAKGK